MSGTQMLIVAGCPAVEVTTAEFRALARQVGAIESGSSAAVRVWEILWAAPFGSAVRREGGQLAAGGRIPVRAVIAAAEADAAETGTATATREETDEEGY